MATECRQDSFDFGTVEGRAVVGAFDGGVISSDAGALLLGAADEAVELIDRFAACFRDGRRPEFIEHTLETLTGQRVFGIALGYEDLIDHDQLRHDPVMAVLAGKLEARRKECAPVAGKSTLSRLEHAPAEGETFAPARYHKIGHDTGAIEDLFVTLFLEAHAEPPDEITIDMDATDDPLHGHQVALLPRLLRQLLLPAALRLLRPAPAGGQAAARQHRRLGGGGRGDRAHRGPDPGALAQGQDPLAGRLGR